MTVFNDVKTKKDWQDLVASHAASELSQSAFCKLKNISVSKFGYYRSLSLPKEMPTLPDNKTFSPVQIKKTESPSSDIKIILPNGFQCFFPSHLDSHKVKELLGVLLSC